MPASPDPAPEDAPDTGEERIRALAEREERVASLAKGALNLLLAAGGVAVVASFLTPRRIAGASRSAFLEWQARDAEIARAHAAAPPSSPEAKP